MISNSSYLWGFYNDTIYMATDTVSMCCKRQSHAIFPVGFSTSIAIACVCCVQLYAKVLDVDEGEDERLVHIPYNADSTTANQ